VVCGVMTVASGPRDIRMAVGRSRGHQELALARSGACGGDAGRVSVASLLLANIVQSGGLTLATRRSARFDNHGAGPLKT